MSKVEMHSVGRDAAINLAMTGWWKTQTPRQIVEFQLFTTELCMDFEDFHKALETVLNRPVFTHEFGLDYGGIVKEFLGEKRAPSLEEIVNLIPADKRLIVSVVK